MDRDRDRWQQMVKAMARAHPGAVVVMFHRHGSDLDPGLADAWMQIGLAAQLQVGHLDWVVAHGPAALRRSLAERVRGLNGLVLAEDHLCRLDTECCRRFLRNVVASLGNPELAQSVIVPGAGIDVNVDRPDGQVEVRLPDRLQNSPVILPAGSTTSDCSPALRTAVEGTDLTAQNAMKPPRHRR